MTSNIDGAMTGIGKWIALGLGMLLLYGAVFHDSHNESPKEKMVIQVDNKNYTCTQGVK